MSAPSYSFDGSNHSADFIPQQGSADEQASYPQYDQFQNASANWEASFGPNQNSSSSNCLPSMSSGRATALKTELSAIIEQNDLNVFDDAQQGGNTTSSSNSPLKQEPSFGSLPSFPPSLPPVQQRPQPSNQPWTQPPTFSPSTSRQYQIPQYSVTRPPPGNFSALASGGIPNYFQAFLPQQFHPQPIIIPNHLFTSPFDPPSRLNPATRLLHGSPRRSGQHPPLYEQQSAEPFRGIPPQSPVFPPQPPAFRQPFFRPPTSSQHPPPHYHWTPPTNVQLPQLPPNTLRALPDQPPPPYRPPPPSPLPPRPEPVYLQNGTIARSKPLEWGPVLCPGSYPVETDTSPPAGSSKRPKVKRTRAPVYARPPSQAPVVSALPIRCMLPKVGGATGEVCGAEFESADQLMAHIGKKGVHGICNDKQGKEKFACEWEGCTLPHKLTGAGGRLRHIREVHAGQKRKKRVPKVKTEGTSG